MRWLHRLNGRERWSRRGAFGVLAATLAVALLGNASPAFAQLTITPTFGSSITSDPNAAAIEAVINNAILTYQADFSDPINVTIQFNEMTSGLGQSTTGFFNVSYNTFITALRADAKTADDATAISLLPVANNNPVNNNTTINVKTANLRAVGLPGAGFVNGTFDGAIGLNTHITDVGSPGTSGQFSLRATAQHEIDEVLGLGSSLPNIAFSTIFPQDLYRYNGSGARSFTTTSTATAFFSINGTTNLAQFDNQNDGGDFGDWQSNPRPNGVPPQVQDAFATAGASPVLGVELRALDVIGYDLVTTAAVPEPSQLALLGLLGAVGAVGYARRKRAAA
jgi:hypothetical protein